MKGVRVGARRLHGACVAVVYALLFASGAPLLAQGGPLAVRQASVRQQIRAAEETLLRLAEALNDTEPENARRLLQAVQVSREALLERRMGDVVRLLEEGRLDAGHEEQQKILEDLARVLRLLTEQISAEEQRRRRIEQLEQWRRQVDELLREQHAERRASEDAVDPEAAAAGLRARIATLERLIPRQEALAQESRQAGAQGLHALSDIGGRQAALRQETDALAKDATAGRRAPDDPPDTEPGEKPLKDAVRRQADAESSLDKGKARTAAEAQDDAAAAMRRALAEMKDELARIQRPPSDRMEAMARAQAGTAGKAGELHGAMSKASRAAGAQEGASGGAQGAPSEGAQGGDQPGEPQPGQPQVQQAEQAMRRAEEALRRSAPERAQPEQQQALDRLKEARRALEEVLAQLREEEQEQLLAALETYFREMLERQKPVTLLTAELDRLNLAGRWQRAEQLKCAELSREEKSLAELAQKVLDILLEEGTTIVFPRVVANLRDDLDQVHRRLGQAQVDAYTQTVQREIERTLEDLLAALERQRQEREQNPSRSEPSQPQQQIPPLVSETAELKMLRSEQLRVNRLTRALDEARARDGAEAGIEGDVQRTARRQAELADMALRMIENP